MSLLKYYLPFTTLLFFHVLQIQAQQAPEYGLSNFKILVETAKGKITLTCTEGCEFTQQTFHKTGSPDD
jgi:hypothetical protein